MIAFFRCLFHRREASLFARLMAAHIRHAGNYRRFG